MNLDEAKETIKYLIENQDKIGITVYGLMKSIGNPTPLTLDIESNNSTNPIKKMFLKTLEETFLKNENTSLINLSSADDRVDALYLYDMPLPDNLKCLETVLTSTDIPKLNLANTSLANIQGLIIELGDNSKSIAIYKQLPSIHVIGQSQIMMIKSNQRLEKVDSELLRISGNIHMVRFKDGLVITDLKILEKNFGFDKIIQTAAHQGLDAIKNSDLLENPEIIEEDIKDISFARKLTKVANSSQVLLKAVPTNKIIEFCQKKSHFKRIRFNQEKTKILLDTKVSKKLFIDLLMDNYLTSELTETDYSSIAKDLIT